MIIGWQARAIWADRPIGTLLSLGCGRPVAEGAAESSTKVRRGANGCPMSVIASPIACASIPNGHRAQATGIVFTITGASDMTLQEVNEAAEAIYSMSHPDANIIFGSMIDEDMGSVISITVVATGFAADRR